MQAHLTLRMHARNLPGLRGQVLQRMLQDGRVGTSDRGHARGMIRRGKCVQEAVQVRQVSS